METANHVYGLVGYRLAHSFSRNFFNEKFENEKIPAEYRNFELDRIEDLRLVVEETPELCGLNVTIPYKESIIPLLDEMDGTAPFNYPRLVQPIWDKHCVSCHGAGTKLDLTGTIDEDHWSVSYRNLRPYAFFYDGGGGYVESKTYPGKFGAMASPLYYLLEQGHKGVELSPEEMRRVAIWLDCNSDFYGTYEDTEAQKRGEVVFPILE